MVQEMTKPSIVYGSRIDSQSDIADAVAAGLECGGLLVDESDISPSFFQLSSGLAGELFKNFVNYRFPLALVFKNPSEYGERFNELVAEHRTHSMIRILSDQAKALQWLAGVRNRPQKLGLPGR